MSPLRHLHPALTWHSWQFWTVIAYMALAVGFGLGFTENQDRIGKTNETICLFGRLFGLDKPLPARALQRLRPIQVSALNDIYRTCPEFGRKWVHR